MCSSKKIHGRALLGALRRATDLRANELGAHLLDALTQLSKRLILHILDGSFYEPHVVFKLRDDLG